MTYENFTLKFFKTTQNLSELFGVVVTASDTSIKLRTKLSYVELG